MRLTHALAAAALTAGLVAAAPAAQAAPVAAPAAHSQQVFHAAAASKSSKASTKSSIKGRTTVKAGDDITITGTLTRKSGSKYKAYAKAELELVLLDTPDAESGDVLDAAKTDKKGKVTWALPTEAEDAGQSYSFLVAYEGGSKAKASESKVITVTVSE